jgi:antitoxin (DNA-binding transcriptional repressor) of toxin-antitoxin stability system
MGPIQVGVRELKSRLSHYLRQVKAGQAIVITEHGQPVAQPLEDELRSVAVTPDGATILAGG